MNPFPSLPPLRRRPILGLLAGLALAGAAPAPGTEALPVITDAVQIWPLTSEQKLQRLPLRLEARVNYYDPTFHMAWFETNGTATYIQLSNNPPPLRIGQRVRLTGEIVPATGLDASGVRVEVLQEFEPKEPVDARGRLDEHDTLASRLVRIEGYVDSQQTIDAAHERLTLIAENRTVYCWVRPANPRRPTHWAGRMLRVTGLYSSRFDPSMTRMSIELWVGDEQAVEVIGGLADEPRFSWKKVRIEELHDQPDGARLRVEGRVLLQQPGRSLVLQDAGGEVEVESLQTAIVPVGTRMEVAGELEHQNGWRLRRALCRPLFDETSPPPAESRQRIVEVRALPPAQAREHRPVAVRGMVTWTLPDSDIFILQDPSGGIRVHFNRARTGTILFGKYFDVQATTREGLGSTELDLQSFVDLGSMTHPHPVPLSLEQALTGQSDGDWVEMRGYLQRIESQGDRHRLDLTTATGGFSALTDSPIPPLLKPGSLVRIHGVCDFLPATATHAAGVTLLVPFLHNVYVDASAPASNDELPVRRLMELERLAASSNLLRVRVAGRVNHIVAGRRLYLEDGGAGVLAHVSAGDPVKPGDRVEAIGILGRDGRHLVLREASYRVVEPGNPPVPIPLGNPEQVGAGEDFRLVRLGGRVLNVFRAASQTRLMVRNDGVIFEARLAEPEALSSRVAEGAQLDLTGICQVTYDDLQRARGFELLLRSPADVAVVQAASFWTARRALLLVLMLAVAITGGVTWITALRRRVRQQTAQIRAQLERQAQLDASVQHAARLESIGALAGGIAHDYNNLLTVIMGHLSLMKLSPGVGGVDGQRIAEIERAALRARDLARQLLTFASGGAPRCEPVDLRATVQEAVNAVLRGPQVRAEVAESAGLWAVSADRDQLVQAIQNILQNAVQAMPEGGRVLIALANEPLAAARPGLAAGDYVRLRITDTGRGIDPAILGRIFDPFFTTRPEARGLGLATAYSILHKHGGTIEASSPAGAGATFTLWLPASREPLAARPASRPPMPLEPAPAGRPRVLLMDDEDSVRLLSAAILERMGLDVTAVPDGAAAVQAFAAARSAGRPFALVIADLTIPGGMGGKEAVAEIRRLDTEVPAIVSSGYSRDPIMARYWDHGFQAMVAKPFEVRTFCDTVRKFIPTAKSL